MAYADQKMGSGKIVAIVIVALLHAALGYAFVTGLAFKYVKNVTEDMDVFDVEEPPPPPPDEPPPPPPDQPMQPPPVVSPPAIVRTPQPPVIMQTVSTPPPTIVQTPIAAPPVPAAPVAPRVSQAAKMSVGDLQRTLGNPDNYPADALEAGKGGSVVASLQIGANGRVTSCTVTSGTGTASLDRQTCSLAQRIRATPAKDESGTPIAGPFTLRFRWVPPAD